MKKFGICWLILNFMALGQTSLRADEPRPVLLKIQSAFAAALPGLGTTVTSLAKRLNLISNGQIRVKVYEPNKLVGPSEILDAVAQGKLPAGYAATGFWEGKMRAASFFTSFPFGPEASEYLAWLYYGNGNRLRQEMYDQAGYAVHSMTCGMIGPETSGWFRKPVEKIEDLKGLRMRFYGLGARVMDKVGVTTSMLPGIEVFSALEKGVIDATEFSMPAIDQKLGFHKIAKFNYFPGWHQPGTALELLIHKDQWESMTPAQQALIELACQAGNSESLALSEAIQGRIIQENVAEHGVELRKWPPEILARFEQAWLEVVAEESAKDPFFKKVWDDFQAFHAEYRVWQNYGYLAREQKP